MVAQRTWCVRCTHSRLSVSFLFFYSYNKRYDNLPTLYYIQISKLKGSPSETVHLMVFNTIHLLLFFVFFFFYVTAQLITDSKFDSSKHALIKIFSFSIHFRHLKHVGICDKIIKHWMRNFLFPKTFYKYTNKCVKKYFLKHAAYMCNVHRYRLYYDCLVIRKWFFY